MRAVAIALVVLAPVLAAPESGNGEWGWDAEPTLAPGDTSGIPLAIDFFERDLASPLFRFSGWAPRQRRGWAMHTTETHEAATITIDVQGTSMVLLGTRDPPSPESPSQSPTPDPPSNGSIGPDSGVTVRDGAGRVVPFTQSEGVLAEVREPFEQLEIEMAPGGYSVSSARVETSYAVEGGVYDSKHLRFVEDAEHPAVTWEGTWSPGRGASQDDCELDEGHRGWGEEDKMGGVGRDGRPANSRPKP